MGKLHLIESNRCFSNMACLALEVLSEFHFEQITSLNCRSVKQIYDYYCEKEVFAKTLL
jgi:hypothetical protein